MEAFARGSRGCRVHFEFCEGDGLLLSVLSKQTNDRMIHLLHKSVCLRLLPGATLSVSL